MSIKHSLKSHSLEFSTMSAWLAIRLPPHSCSHFCVFPHTHKQVSLRQEEEGANNSNQAQQPSSVNESSPNQPEVTFWQEVMDANTNHVYYWNPDTNEVTWTLPANGVITNEVAGGGGDDGSGMGTGQDGMEMEKSTGGGGGAESKEKSELVSSQKETAKKSSATKKVAKEKADIDMFASPMEEEEEASSKKEELEAAVTVSAPQEERSSPSKKRKASPPRELSDSGTEKEPAGI